MKLAAIILHGGSISSPIDSGIRILCIVVYIKSEILKSHQSKQESFLQERCRKRDFSSSTREPQETAGRVGARYTLLRPRRGQVD